MHTAFSQSSLSSGRLKSGTLRLPGALLLAGCTLLAYWGALSNDFVNYDDYRYVLENPLVRAGLSLNGFQWAWTNLDAGFWHPLTWLSHMLDCEIYGLNPMGHHLSSLVLHIANSVLLFLLLARITGRSLRSWLVAALFALHPLHVESVAWVSERKDVLSTLFCILSIRAYASYAHGRGRWKYGLSLGLFLLGLMAKSMLVTLPFVLLLLDYWPLARLFPRSPAAHNAQGEMQDTPPLRILLIEKLPFLGLSLFFTLVTWLAENRLDALPSIESIPMGLRAQAVLAGYASYLVKTLLPDNLSVLYLRPLSWNLWEIIGSALLLAVVSAAAARTWRTRPYLAVGWLWYLITLLPVSGIVLIGSHFMADRYTYIPLIGIFMIIAWGIPDLLAGRLPARFALPLIAGSALAVLSFCTWNQIKYWHNSVTLFEQATRATRENYLAHYNLGFVLAQRGRLEEALTHFQEAVRINPGYVDARLGLAQTLEKLGK